MKKQYEIKFHLNTFTIHEAEPSKEGSYIDEIKILSSQEFFHYAKGIYSTLDADKEHCVLFSLNNKNVLTGEKTISTGSLTASLVHPREVFRAAVNLDAAAIIMVHNHPSGDPIPSPEDREITKRLMGCADLFGIRFLDHIILGEDRYFSFGDSGNL